MQKLCLSDKHSPNIYHDIVAQLLFCSSTGINGMASFEPSPLTSLSRHTNAPYFPYSYTQVQVQAAKDIIEANRDVIVGVGCTPAR